MAPAPTMHIEDLPLAAIEGVDGPNLVVLVVGREGEGLLNGASSPKLRHQYTTAYSMRASACEPVLPAPIDYNFVIQAVAPLPRPTLSYGMRGWDEGAGAYCVSHRIPAGFSPTSPLQSGRPQQEHFHPARQIQTVFMPRRPRELLNAQMRTELRKRLRTVVPPPVSDIGTSAAVDEFADTFQSRWVRIPEHCNGDGDEEGTLLEKEKEQATPPNEGDEKTEAQRKVHAFCNVLAEVQSDFQNSNRPYAAVMAQHAIHLVREGKQDDINPGLWAFVNAKEKAMREKDKPP